MVLIMISILMASHIIIEEKSRKGTRPNDRGKLTYRTFEQTKEAQTSLQHVIKDQRMRKQIQCHEKLIKAHTFPE